jgi:hypothetical protein
MTNPIPTSKEDPKFPALGKVLEFLKYDPQEIKDITDTIATTIGVVSGVVSLVGTAQSVIALGEKLGIFKSSQDDTEKRLKQMSQQIEQIYGYLAAADKRGLYDESKNWRAQASLAASWSDNVKLSRKIDILNALNSRAGELDEALMAMLWSGNIAFQRAAYGYQPDSQHWIDAASSPYMYLANGSAISYANPSQNLVAEIWDPGYFIDVLTLGLNERIAAATALEPAFRSTGFERSRMGDIAEGLDTFIRRWRDSLIVANPAAGLNGGGLLHNPLEDQHYAATGITLGAADPVTGVSNVHTWDGFSIKYSRTSLPFSAWGGLWDESYATDPQAALAAATSLQSQLLDEVIDVTGISGLSQLQQQFLALSQTPQGSDFVDCSDPLFTRLGGPTKGPTETVDLGSLKKYAANPNKTYAALRFNQQMEKKFTFRIAKRADYSGIQLGYRIGIGGKSLDLCKYSDSSGVTNLAPLDQSIDITGTFFDCFQDRHFSPADEDEFERTGEMPAGQRLLWNSRTDHAAVRVQIDYAPDGGDMVYWREVHVTLRTAADVQTAAAFITDVTVFETHAGHDLNPIEVLADQLTVLMVPSYLIVSDDFFTDWAFAMTNMIRQKIAAALAIKFSLKDLEVPTHPFPDPQYAAARFAVIAEHGVAYLEAASGSGVPGVATALRRFDQPRIEGPAEHGIPGHG